ncbi:uncharacterized protein TEOVI_000490800 [Trypanosoma equiperdum]|uniref:ENT domain-containing protein n=2 Tax=Trypanozoon TaxID=39700 RepID=Q385P5_TRYB2|nr:hypothetical protein, conserved [Trypanosoma brucei brucei TREU927]EAN79486.1 hypothetical protein, conserved [Trypanosoma brucei brucei TREU927]SCU66388.1 hypothetical protein, conserved [Trypanosoma equiperdum]
MSASGSGVAAIYGRAEEAQNAPVKLQPVPAFELYKAAREEELCSYRSLCRVLCMHSGGKLTKQQRRILEDMREELCLPTERAEAELAAAREDVLVTSVAASGVLKRRQDFFDGVTDVPLDTLSYAESAKDDNNSLYVAQTKVARTEQIVGGVHGRHAAPSKMSIREIHKNLERIGREVAATSSKLLYCTSVVDQQAYRNVLQQKREQLQAMLREVEDAPPDMSGIASVMPSEHVY